LMSGVVAAKSIGVSRRAVGNTEAKADFAALRRKEGVSLHSTLRWCPQQMQFSQAALPPAGDGRRTFHCFMLPEKVADAGLGGPRPAVSPPRWRLPSLRHRAKHTGQRAPAWRRCFQRGVRCDGSARRSQNFLPQR
jgi:hypothetical protein